MLGERAASTCSSLCLEAQGYLQAPEASAYWTVVPPSAAGSVHEGPGASVAVARGARLLDQSRLINPPATAPRPGFAVAPLRVRPSVVPLCPHCLEQRSLRGACEARRMVPSRFGGPGDCASLVWKNGLLPFRRAPGPLFAQRKIVTSAPAPASRLSSQPRISLERATFPPTPVSTVVDGRAGL